MKSGKTSRDDVLGGSEEERAEEKLRANERRLRSMIDKAQDSIFSKDSERRYTLVNPAAQRLLGLSEQEVLGKTPEEIFGPEQGAMVKQLDDRTFCGETVSETRRLVVGGEEMFLHSVQTPLDIENGEVTSIMGIVRDITKRIVAERAIRAERDFTNTLLDTAQVIILALNTDGKIVRFNKFMEHLTGYALDEVAGRDWFDTFLPEHGRSETRELFKKAVSDIATSGNVSPIVARDGRIIEVEWYDKTLRDSEGNVRGLLAVGLDVTERRRTEQMLQNTQRLESLGLLAGGIAHDFNNLLGGIFGVIDLARAEIDNRQQVLKYLDLGMAALDRAKDLTQQLLTFAKGGVPQKTAVDIKSLIGNCLALSLSGSSIECDVRVNEDVPNLHADVNQLSQVLNNILLNSRQAMPDGGKIVISAENRRLSEYEVAGLQAGDYVKIEVEDSGGGIPKTLLNRVFDPFFTTKEEGSGLGLAMCHSIINKHDGAIAIHSQLGRGTTLRIYLPTTDSAMDLETEAEVFFSRMGGRVLVMDDEEVMRGVAEGMLRILGFDVVSTRSGGEAVEVFEREMRKGTPFDLVLLDLTVLGGIGGEQAMAEIKKIDPRAVGIVASGYADSPVLANPAVYGFAGKLEKPFHSANLRSAVKAALGHGLNRDKDSR